MRQELRVSISFNADDPEQVLIYKYLKGQKKGYAAVKLTRYLPLGILAHRDLQRQKLEFEYAQMRDQIESGDLGGLLADQESAVSLPGGDQVTVAVQPCDVQEEVPSAPEAPAPPPIVEETTPAMPAAPPPQPEAVPSVEPQSVQDEEEPSADDLLLLEQLKGFSSFYGG